MSKSEYLLPDYVFNDIKESLRKQGKNLVFSTNRFKKIATNDTLKWFESFKYSPKYVAMFVKKEQHVVIPICCKTCGKELSEKSALAGKLYCCCQCGYNNPETLAKRKATMLARYGVDNPSKSEVFQQKKSETVFKHYGVSHYSKTEEHKKHLHELGIDRYVLHPELGKETQRKVHETKIKKYGENYATVIRQKSQATLKSRIGVDNPFKSKEIQKQIQVARRKTLYNKFVSALNRKHIILLSSEQDYIEVKPLKFRCTACGHEWTSDGKDGSVYNITCSECNRHLVSRAEKELLGFVKSIYSGTIIENDRKLLGNGQELDIVVPDKKVAIEFDGSFYHSDLFKDKNYHLNKTNLCLEKGYRLIHVFEYDWLYRRSIVESIIASSLGIFSHRVYARKCEIGNISNKEYREFLEENHLQTPINSSIRLGLKFNNELVAVVGFGQSRFKKNEFELHRFCIKRSYQVIGALSKLIKHANIKHFMTYVDRAHFTGNGYLTCGFKLLSNTQPNYVYTKWYHVLSRMACQKHKLPALLGEKFDPTKSEYENMTLNGWNRIYDCGNLKLEYIA